MFKILRPVLSILIAFVIFFAFVRPMFADIQALQAESAQYEEAIAEANSFNRLLDGLLARKNSFNASELDRLNAMVPEEPNEVEALVDIQALAEENGLTFGTVDLDIEDAPAEEEEPEEGAPAGADAEVRDITFTVRGNYEEFKAFLRALERSLVLMEVMNISFESTGLITTYTMTVRLFGAPEVN